MTIWMPPCDAAHIQWITTRASRGATGRCQKEITRTVLPRRVRHGHRCQQHSKHTHKTFSFMVYHNVRKASKKRHKRDPLSYSSHSKCEFVEIAIDSKKAETICSFSSYQALKLDMNSLRNSSPKKLKIKLLKAWLYTVDSYSLSEHWLAKTFTRRWVCCAWSFTMIFRTHSPICPEKLLALPNCCI